MYASIEHRIPTNVDIIHCFHIFIFDFVNSVATVFHSVSSEPLTVEIHLEVKADCLDSKVKKCEIHSFIWLY